MRMTLLVCVADAAPASASTPTAQAAASGGVALCIALVPPVVDHGSSRRALALRILQLRRPHVQSLRGLLAHRLLDAADADGHLARRLLQQLELGARGEPLVVEPVQQLAVVLGEPDDGRVAAGRE